MSVNKVILIGRLGKDPEVRAMDNGRKVANFSIATDDSYKDRDGNKVERTDWHNIVFWGPQAEIIERYVQKGRLVYVEGRLKTRSYEQDGVTKYITEVLGSQITMLGGREDNSGGSQMSAPAAATPSSAPVNSTATEEVDDLPF